MSFPDGVRQKYILGLDLGSASIGWAVIDLDGNLDPCGLLAAGSHIFDPGVEVPPAAGKMARDEAVFQGLDRSKAVGRRIARQMRRQIDRKGIRLKALFKLLQSKSLLPIYPELKGEPLAAERHHLFTRLDKELTDALCAEKRKRGTDGLMLEADQALPYVLRKEALERKLELHELGRALYHLCQRRGYRPSAADDSEKEETASTEEEIESKRGRRKKPEPEDKGDKDSESPKKVAEWISDLQAKMDAAHTPTIGAYFADFKNNNPHQERIRHRWTGREMFVKEFDLIWERQSEFYRDSRPGLLNDDLRNRVYDCLFFQRPLASAEHLIGMCDLERGERRAPWATLEAQRFRLLQKVNDLAYIPSGLFNERKLSLEQCATLAAALQDKGDMPFPEIAKLLGLPPKTEFNLMRGKKKKIEGNRINQVMLQVFGDRWRAFTEQERSSAVALWTKTEGFEERKNVAISQCGLDPWKAKEWAENRPPKDCCRHSRKALVKLIKRMEEGVPYATAKLEIYDSQLAGKAPLDFVPKVIETLPSINNPAVLRALTELRKVVNAIIRTYGDKPYEIRIELARELRKNRKQRQNATEAGDKQHLRRIDAARTILRECRNYDAQGRDAERLVRERRDDVTKMLLLMECRCLCPYTGDSISYLDLFGGEVEVEHIIPQSLMVDNSFNNLTLCYRKVNHEKLDKTPRQAFCRAEDDQQWIDIIGRVQKFGNKEKLHRFLLSSREDIDRFSNRRLNDTRYTSKLAGRLLMSLYGGRDIVPAETLDELDEFKDRTGRRAICVSSGMVTSLLRDAWHLNLSGVIGDDAFKCPKKSEDDEESGKRRKGQSNKKDRCDHRHHALDAVVIALTSEKVIREINMLASRLYRERQTPLKYRDLKSIQNPWHNFMDDHFRDIFRGMLVSHRPEHKLSGALHEATSYGKVRYYNAKGDPVRYQRIAIGKLLTDKQIEKIVDEEVKKSVVKLGETIGGYKKWSQEKHGWPKMPNRNGEPVPIKKVRIKITKNAKEIEAARFRGFGTGRPESNVEDKEIAYASFFTVQDRKGTKTVWEIVKLFEAAQRVRALPKSERGHEKICWKYPKYPDATFFRFSLMKGDLVELVLNGKPAIFIVRRFEFDSRLWVAPINAAGKDEEMEAAGHLLRLGFSRFLTMGAGDDKIPRPVFVDLLGQPHYINIGA